MQRIRILAPILAIILALGAGAANEAQGGTVTPYTVDLTSDANITTCTGAAGDCSLRGAIFRANAASSPGDVIIFDPLVFPAGAPATIASSSVLSMSAGSDTINATGRGVIVDGVNVEPAYAAFSCLRIDSDSNQVAGLQVTDCLFGIEVTSVADSNNLSFNVLYDNSVGIGLAGNSSFVNANNVGTNAAGTAIHPDGGNNTGISVTGDGNLIGSESANVISGNLTNGVDIQPNANLTEVAGNFIGTDIEGESDLGNGVTGIQVFGTNSTIGGDVFSSLRNVISGNLIGISISGAAATGNAVLNNYIGTTADGEGDLGNTADGINISNAPGNCIGGTLVIVATVCTTGTASRNVISGNGGAGLAIFGATATNNSILGNDIGLQADGSTPLGNGNNGIAIDGGASGTDIGTYNPPTNPNRIAHNVGDGIFIASGSDNGVGANEIFTNSGLGIDLGTNGVTPNDTDDPDSGANGLQNFPVLTGVLNTGSGIVLQGTMNTTASTEINIQVFHSATCDPSGKGEGESYVGAFTVNTDVGGDAAFNASLAGERPAFRYITAIATPDSIGNSSEFSNCVQVPPIVVNSAAHPGDGACTLANCTLNEAIIAANTAPELSVIHFAIGSGPQTIAVTGELNAVATQMWINGTTQPGYAGTPIIEIDGTNGEEGSSGLGLLADGNIVEGLVINRFDEDGIRIVSQANVIRNNYIGTDIAGTGDLGNGRSGIYVTAPNNVIGGDTAADRNVISGNNNDGVRISGLATAVTVKGNYIGTNAAGTATLGNSLVGVRVEAGADNNYIGGTTSGERNVISGNSNGVLITGSDSIQNSVSGNYIGTNAAGTAALGNSQTGVSIDGDANANTIGGLTADARNVISGNVQTGVRISGSGTDNNAVVGNYIGTNAAGTAGLSATAKGVELTAGADLNNVGFTLAGSGNVISGNFTGIEITGLTTLDNTIQGNFIGTNAAGTGTVLNQNGIYIVDASNTVIGGGQPGARNIISGNALSSIQIQNASATGTTIKGNYIGTDVTGMVGLGNGGYGVLVVQGNATLIGGTVPGEGNVIAATHPNGFGSPGYGILINSDNNTIQRNLIGTRADGVGALGNEADGIFIGGRINNTIGHILDPAVSNTIAFNGGAGVRITSSGNNTGNFIRRNSIHSNVGLGVDLGTAGVTPNDSADPDIGANGLQNFPVLTSVAISPPNITIEGTLNSAASFGFAYTLEFFQTYACDSSGHGEGKDSIGVLGGLLADGVSNTPFTFTTAATLAAGSFVTATASNTGGTSEFSACIAAVNDGDDDNDGYTDVNENGAPLCLGNLNEDALDDALVNDGCPVSDLTEDACGENIVDNDGDGFVNDGCPASGAPEVACADAADSDGDELVNDGCPAVGPTEDACVDADDDDADGFVNDGCLQAGSIAEAAFNLDSFPNDPCGEDGWPSDVFSSGLSLNKLDIQDLISFVAPTRRLDKSPGQTGFSKEWDMTPGPNSPFPNFISIFDLTTLLNGVPGSPAYPPMFGGPRAFGKDCPFPP